MQYVPKPLTNKPLYYATELHHKNGTDNLMWQRKVPTGWLNHTRVYREIEKASPE
jgi:hypothetical protein